MSRRVFYIVHLDKGRIAALSLLASGLLLTAFATGYRIAGNSPARDVGPFGISASESETEPSLALNDASSPSAIGDDGANRASSADNDKRDDRNSDSLNDRSNDSLAQRDRSSDEPSTQRRERVNLLDSAMDADASPADTSSERKTDQLAKRDRDDKPKKKREEKKKNVKKEKQKEPTTAKKKEKAEKNDQGEKTEKKTAKSDVNPDAKSETKRDAKAEPKSEEKSVYVLQMGAYQSREAALRLSEQIRKHGIQTYVRKAGNIHTVRTEGTSNREELFKTENKLKSLNFSPVTVMIRGK